MWLKNARPSLKNTWMGAYVALKPVHTFQHWWSLSLCARWVVHMHSCIPIEMRAIELSADNKMVPLLFSPEDVASMIFLTTEQFSLCLSPFQMSFGPERQWFWAISLPHRDVSRFSESFAPFPFNCIILNCSTICRRSFLFDCWTSTQLYVWETFYTHLLHINLLSCNMFLYLFPFSTIYFSSSLLPPSFFRFQRMQRSWFSKGIF